MRILLTGRHGQLGEVLASRLHDCGELIATSRSQLDLEDPGAIRDAVCFVRPDLIINAAAYTAADLAERDPDRAFRVNGRAPGILAAEAASIGAGVLHYSTGCVFDGLRPGGYREGDATNPLSEYGRSKLAGEAAIREAGVAHAIVRLGWLYGGRHGNFLSTMMRLLRERVEVRAVDDQVGCPTSREAVADATCVLVGRMLGDGSRPAEFLAAHGGTFHLAGPGSTSWCGFATAIAEELTQRGERVACVRPVSAAHYPRPAVRPASSILLSDLIRDRFGVSLPTWRAQLSASIESTRLTASAA